MTKDHDVGYGKPPKAHRFRRGQSGNPRGRPKRERYNAIDLSAVLGEPISAETGKGRRRMPGFEAGLRKLASRALEDGDVKAAISFLKLCAEHHVLDHQWSETGQPIGIVMINANLTQEEWLALYDEQQERKENTERARLLRGPKIPPTRGRRTPEEILTAIAYEKRQTDQGQRHTTLELVLGVLREAAASGDVRALEMVGKLEHRFGRQRPPEQQSQEAAPRLTQEEWLELFQKQQRYKESLPGPNSEEGHRLRAALARQQAASTLP
jgi:hypothetical protein